MKKIWLIVFLFCGLNVLLAQKDTGKKAPKEKYIDNTYCMTLKDGIPVLMFNGLQVVSDVVLENGTRITPGGRLIKSNGAEIVLHEKDCVNSVGELIRAGTQAGRSSGKRNKK